MVKFYQEFLDINDGTRSTPKSLHRSHDEEPRLWRHQSRCIDKLHGRDC